MIAVPPRSDVLIVPYGDRRLRCDVRRASGRNQHRVAIHVDPDGHILVDAPQRATDAEIRLALTKRARWVQNRLQEIDDSRRHVLPREYISGESVYYMGRRYRLKVLSTRESPAVRLHGGYLHVAIGSRNPDEVRVALHAWYQARAKRILRMRLEEVCGRLPWIKQLPPTCLRKMKARWGSCSPTGRLTLNPDLVRAPRECIDYVIAHELCHLRVHDHSPRFYRLLDAAVPNWKEVKSRLDQLAEAVLAT